MYTKKFFSDIFTDGLRWNSLDGSTACHTNDEKIKLQPRTLARRLHVVQRLLRGHNMPCTTVLQMK